MADDTNHRRQQEGKQERVGFEPGDEISESLHSSTQFNSKEEIQGCAGGSSSDMIFSSWDGFDRSSAAEHDGGGLAELTDDFEVVRNQNHTRFPAGDGTGEHVEDLRLNRNIERRNRFVEDQSSGSGARARAIAIRCRSPPEKASGNCSAASAGRPT